MPTYSATPSTKSVAEDIYSAVAPELFVVDVGPLFPGYDDVPGVFFAARSMQRNHSASITVFESRDGGTTYHEAKEIPIQCKAGDYYGTRRWWTAAASADSFTIDPSTHQILEDSGSELATGWDEASKLSVSFNGMTDPGGNPYTLASATEIEVLNGQNRLVLDPNGSPEVISFKTATVTTAASGTYKLTSLLRGQRGSEVEIANLSGARISASESRFPFVVVDEAAFVFHAVDPADIGKEIHYKALPAGMAIAAATDTSAHVTHTVQGNNVAPFHPAHIEGSRDGSNNLTVTWKRRTRSKVRLMGAKAQPYGEDRDAYEVDFYNTAGSSVLRTVAVTAATASYTAAQQTADGLTPGAAVKCKVYQLSNTAGRGRSEMTTV